MAQTDKGNDTEDHSFSDEAQRNFTRAEKASSFFNPDLI